MKFLNLGCGSHYSTKQEWTNLDFVSSDEFVIAHNLLNGIPFSDSSFDVVYHSHVLEHFSKEDGIKMIAECFRVLAPGGVIRIAVPDLERIARNYVRLLEEGLKNPKDELVRANYEWTLIEMYDQVVRTESGGNMAKFLSQEIIKNENFVFERIGEEGKAIRTGFLNYLKDTSLNGRNAAVKKDFKNFTGRLKLRFKKYLLKKAGVNENALSLGKFRMGGEVHQWMYDRYSLENLLSKSGGCNIQIVDAFTSRINNWADYNIDGKNGIVRKPDSLFMEASK